MEDSLERHLPTILAKTFGTLSLFYIKTEQFVSPPPPLNNVGCPGLKHVSKILFSLSTSTLFRGGGGNKFLIFFSDLTLSAIFLFHKKLLQKCQLSLNQLARIVACSIVTIILKSNIDQTLLFGNRCHSLVMLHQVFKHCIM